MLEKWILMKLIEIFDDQMTVIDDVMRYLDNGTLK